MDNQEGLKMTDSISNLRMTNSPEWLKVKEIGYKIFNAGNLDEILIDLHDDILALFEVERFTIYVVDGIRRELVSRIKSGNELNEIRVAISNESIAGYTCANKKVVSVTDVYDDTELTRIDDQLKFDQRWDRLIGFRTKTVLSVPVLYKKLQMGVIQLINRKGGDKFSLQDAALLQELADILGIATYNHKNMAASGKSGRFDYLMGKSFISKNELETARAMAKKTGRLVENVLVNEFQIPKSEVGKALSQYYGMPFIEYNHNMPVPVDLLRQTKEDFIRKELWVPLRQKDNEVLIAIDNPLNLIKTDHIQRIFRDRKITFCVAMKEDILAYINCFYKGKAEPDDQAPLPEKEIGLSDNEVDLDSLVTDESNDIVRLVNKIILDACEKGASDIHIEPSTSKMETRIRIRVDGTCSQYQTVPLTYSKPLAARIKIMANLDIAEHRLPQDGKIKFSKYGSKDIELRVATLPTQDGQEDVVMRILAAGKPLPLDKMGFSDHNYNNFIRIITQPYGLIFVCGPTGSGKTTTLHSALGFINKEDKKIWTAEDPVEITQEGLRQIQVMPKIGLTFARAMRAFLRADPDVIMVGEMRDPETTAIGIEASLTGHLVLSTLHTNSAPESLSRLIDMGMDPFNFADAILCVLAQRLVRTLCNKCKKPYTPGEEEYRMLVDEYGPEFFDKNVGISYSNELKLYRPMGCASCNNTGYAGRMGLHELLIGTDKIKRMIRTKETIEVIRDQAIQDGMTTLKQDGIAKIFAGHCDFVQVKRVCIK
ncbi:MAG: ATPase, T2SS/T4P/T4SS family [Thermodesulfobacteriota bacterium]|nr:ATPase, T2SS/T4P/T4SS family [Thermodesulfobacteriota bacterium]